MLLHTKFFKVTLPLATAGTAIIVTAYLISSITKELDKKKEEDPALENIELKSQEFKEELIQNDQEESEKDEKSDSSPGEDKKDTLDQEKDKSKQEVSSEEELKQTLSEADNLIKQLAEQGGPQGAKEKQLEIQGNVKINPAEGEETVANKEGVKDQNLSSTPLKGSEEENPQLVGKPEEDISQETKAIKEKELSTVENSPEVPESGSEVAPDNQEVQVEGEERSGEQATDNDSEVSSLPKADKSTEAQENLGDQVPSSEEESITQLQSNEEEAVSELDEGKDSDSSESNRGEPTESSDIDEGEDPATSSKDGGRADSEGSEEKGDATVQNLKLYQDLQEQLLGGINSMKRFFN